MIGCLVLFFLVFSNIFDKKLLNNEQNIQNAKRVKVNQTIKTKSFYLKNQNYHSQNVLVYDLTADKMIYQKNTNQKIYPASLVKIMTAVVVLENVEDLEKKLIINPGVYYKMKRQNMALAGFNPNQSVSIRNLLYGALSKSGAEATQTLANYVEQKTGKKFYELMNQKAQQLKMNNTNYINSTGGDDQNQFTTVNDLLKLIKYAIKNQDFQEIITTKHREIMINQQRIIFKNTITKNLSNQVNGFKILGGKSGTTKKAGLCWATFFHKNNHLLLSITMNAPFINWQKESLIRTRKEDLMMILNNLEYK